MLSSRLQDTIFALSSAKGRAAIALNRVSGPESYSKLKPHLHTVLADGEHSSLNSKHMAPPLVHSQARYCLVVDSNGMTIDDCIVTYFKAPMSYTGEDTIEICSHGNPLITARLHSLFREIGMRDAMPGEFTQRAYLNGKMDLTKAEAIDQLIHSDTHAGITLARLASDGKISTVSRELRTHLTQVMAYFEAHIDFADDEVGGYDSRSQLENTQAIIAKLTELADSFSTGLRLREGLKIAFLGPPNAGKSSLYNALLGYERAIVTDVPGTTRDVVEDKLTIHNRDFVLLDTAGIRQTQDQVEQIGVARSWSSAHSADVVCLIIDPTSMPSRDTSKHIRAQLEELVFPLKSNPGEKKAVLIVFTKEDCWNPELREYIAEIKKDLSHEQQKTCFVSAKNTQVTELITMLTNIHDSQWNEQSQPESAILISKRQHDKVSAAINVLKQTMELIGKNDFPEKIASTLLLAASHIDEIIGEIGTENVLENIFSSFCIGK